MLGILCVGALHVFTHRSKGPDAGRIAGTGAAALSIWLRRCPHGHAGRQLGVTEDRVGERCVDVVVVRRRLVVGIGVSSGDADLDPVCRHEIKCCRSLCLTIDVGSRSEIRAAKRPVLVEIASVHVIGDAVRTAAHRTGVRADVSRFEQSLHKVALEHLERSNGRTVELTQAIGHR